MFLNSDFDVKINSMMKTDSSGEAPNQAAGPECTPEEKASLALWEKMFVDRFTENDPHYKPYIGKDTDPPPIVDNYFIRKPRQYDK